MILMSSILYTVKMKIFVAHVVSIVSGSSFHRSKLRKALVYEFIPQTRPLKVAG